jgi:hypothetical protein
LAVGLAAVPVANAASWRHAGSISAPEGVDRTFVTDVGTDRTGALTVLYRGRDLNGGWGPMRLRDRPFGGPIGLVNIFDKKVLGGFPYADLEVAPNGRQLLASIDADARGRYKVVARSRRRAGAKWGRPRVVGEGRVRFDEGGIAAPSDVRVALASSGEALIAWQDLRTVSTVARTAGASRFGAPVRFGDRRMDELAMDAHGNALLVATGEEAVLVTRRPAGREFGGAQSLATADARPDGSVRLAVTGSGDAVLAWTELRRDDPDPAESTDNSVAAATGSTVAGFGSARRLTESDVFYPQVAISRGLTAIAWSEVPFGQTVGAFGRTGRPADELQTHVLAPSKSSLELGVGGGLVVARGRATVLFHQGGGGDGFPLRVRQVTGGGRVLGEPQTLTRLTGNLGPGPYIALSRNGRPYVAWPADDDRIEAARASLRSGRFGPPQRIHVERGYDQLQLIPTRGDAMLLAYVRHAWHLLAYGE